MEFIRINPVIHQLNSKMGLGCAADAGKPDIGKAMIDFTK